MSKPLVVYFSASGVTKKVAENIKAAVDGDIYEIKPVVPYTTADLNWMDPKARSTVEMEDKSSRPEMIMDELDVSGYDIIFLGFPIWWYVAPTIVNTFLEAHDFSDKKIVLFATSGGSGFGRTIEFLKNSAPNAKFIRGGLMNGNTSVEAMKAWVGTLNLQ